MIISVVIPTFNRLDILQAALRCIEQQTLPAAQIEVLVVDDGSTDGTVDFLAQYSPQFSFRHFHQPVNKGPASARNVGILAAKGDVVLIINDDTLLAPDAIERHAIVHNATTATPVSVLGRFDLPADFRQTIWGHTLQYSDLLFRYHLLSHNTIIPSHSFWWSCNISTPRKALLEAGLFDESFTDGAWGAEDQELGYRLIHNAVPIIYQENIHATHMHHLTVPGFASMSLARGSGAVILFSKHALSCHYRNDITEQDIFFWKNIPPRLLQAEQSLCNALKETETINIETSKYDIYDKQNYLSKDNFPRIQEIIYSIYKMKTRDILPLLSKYESNLRNSISKHITEKESSSIILQPLYFASIILRYYYDSIAICNSNKIHNFIKNNTTRK